MDPTPILPPWPSQMTHRERFLRQMNFQSVDRCFNREFGYWEDNFHQWPLFRENGVRNNAQADRFFNFDPMPMVSPVPIWIHPAIPKKVIEKREDVWIVQDDEGALRETTPGDSGRSALPHTIRQAVEGPDEWKRYKEQHLALDHPDRAAADAATLKQRHPDDRDYPLGINIGSMIGKIRNLLGVEGLAYACVDHPDMVEDMVETACQLVENSLSQVLPHVQFDYAHGWEDICYNGGPLVSLDFFAQVVVPRYQRITNLLHQHNVHIIFTDTDGDIRLLIPHFLEAGFNTMFPWEVNGCGHPGDTLQRYPGEIRILGGVDKMKLREGRDATRAYLESLVPWVEKGGFIPFCDHRCPPDVDPDNYLYYLDLKRSLFGTLQKT